MNTVVTMKVLSGFAAAFLLGGVLALSVRPQAQESDERDQQDDNTVPEGEERARDSSQRRIRTDVVTRQSVNRREMIGIEAMFEPQHEGQYAKGGPGGGQSIHGGRRLAGRWEIARRSNNAQVPTAGQAQTPSDP